jgi:hypothetical protein
VRTHQAPSNSSIDVLLSARRVGPTGRTYAERGLSLGAVEVQATARDEVLNKKLPGF